MVKSLNIMFQMLCYVETGIYWSNLKEKQIPLWSMQILYLPSQAGILIWSRQIPDLPGPNENSSLV